VIAIGRTAFDAPEIDGVVRVEDGQALAPGSFARVTITAAHEHDLAARPA
jgi:ribosomal protein S12 methylthiotransferase